MADPTSDGAKSAAILVIEDEPLVRDLVAINLQHAGYHVETAATFADGFALLTTRKLDAAIVDVMLPGGDGLTLVQRAREVGVHVPILVLTARADTPTKVRGLDGGADDYLTKPFDIKELLARVRALLRRAGSRAPPAARFEFGASGTSTPPYWIRFDTGQALTNEGEVTLSSKELKIMEQLIAHEDRVLSRTDLLEEAWGMDAFPTDRTVDNFILRLRKLFEPNPESPVHIVTVRGRGYLFRRSA